MMLGKLDRIKSIKLNCALTPYTKINSKDHLGIQPAKQLFLIAVHAQQFKPSPTLYTADVPFLKASLLGIILFDFYKMPSSRHRALFLFGKEKN